MNKEYFLSYDRLKEIEEFTQIAKSDNIKLHSMSYQELIVNMKNLFYEEHKEYIDYLTERYL